MSILLFAHYYYYYYYMVPYCQCIIYLYKPMWSNINDVIYGIVLLLNISKKRTEWGVRDKNNNNHFMVGGIGTKIIKEHFADDLICERDILAIAYCLLCCLATEIRYVYKMWVVISQLVIICAILLIVLWGIKAICYQLNCPALHVWMNNMKR